jgi:cbb3-type cytochrome oxidase subunit 3
MKLSDIMSNAGLSIYAEIALVLFLAVFIAVVIRTWAPSRRRALEEAAQLPLDDGHVVAHHPEEH